MNTHDSSKKISESEKSSDRSIPFRSDGILSQEELEIFTKKNTALSYDPLQAGWILKESRNDLIGFRECLPKKSNSSSFLESRRRDLLNGHMAEIQRAWIPELRRLRTILESNEVSISEILLEATEAFDRLTNKEFESVEIELEDHFRTQLLCSLFATNRLSQEFKSKHITFRNWEANDLEDYHSLLNQEEMWHWIPDAMPEPFTKEIARQFLDLAMRSGRHDVNAIEFKGELVGQIRLLHDPPSKIEGFLEKAPYRVAEISFWIGKPFWGQGIMKSALSSYMTELSRTKEWDAVYAWIHPGNVASAKAIENAGFVRDPWGLESRVASFMRIDGYHRFFNFISKKEK